MTLRTSAPMTTVAALPKVELNVHLAGTIPLRRALTMARRNGVRELLELPEDHLDRARSLDEFLFAFDAIGHAVRSPDDLRRAIRDHLVSAASSGLVHTEVLWTPMVHLDDGIGYQAQLDGLRSGITEAEAESGVTCRLLATIDRERPVADAHALLDLVLAHRDDLVVGVGLAYGERLPAVQFAGVFERAAAAGLGRTAFAGETGDPRDVADCIGLLGCRRISHGYAVLRNRRLKARVRDDGIHFVVTPATITRLRRWGFPDTGGVTDMLGAGFAWSLSTNNPARYRTDLLREYDAAHREGVSIRQLAAAVDAAVDAAFLDAEGRRNLKLRIDERR